MATELKESPRTSIQEFYAGTNIFITGGTGFVGRVLIEKLLRSCNVSKIYFLIRPKKGVDASGRVKDMFKDVVFQRLHEEQPHFLQKVVPLFGDCENPNLGMSEEDINTVINEVNIVFHVAATVNFDEKIQKATLINVRATRDIITMVRKIKNLKFILHVSTAYTHCYQTQLKEEFHEPTGIADQLITLAENLTPDMMEKCSSALIDKYPNTYAMTKSVSEDLVQKANDLPIAMFRPGIIVSTHKEPIPGWINNLYGPQGVSTAAMVGLLRTLHCDESITANIVPVDMSVNALLAIPWESRKKYDEVIEYNKNKVEEEKQSYNIPVYNYDSCSYNPLSWRKFKHLTQINGFECPSVHIIGVYFLKLNKYRFIHTLYTIFLHLLPALIMDSGLRIMGKKPKLYKAYEKVHRFADVISYFATCEFTFNSHRMDELWSKMSLEDKKMFYCNLRELDWDEFFKNYVVGCRMYLLKDPVDTIPKAFEDYYRLKRYTVLVVAIFFLLVGCFVRFLYNLISF